MAVVFHEEEGDEGAKTENVVAQEQDPVADVRTSIRQMYMYMMICIHTVETAL